MPSNAKVVQTAGLLNLRDLSSLTFRGTPRNVGGCGGRLGGLRSIFIAMPCACNGLRTDIHLAGGLPQPFPRVRFLKLTRRLLGR